MKKLFLFGLLVLVLLVAACSQETKDLKTQEGAEKAAERFARYWEQEDIASMYDMFVPGLKEQRSKEDFVKFFLAEKMLKVVVRLDKVSMETENTAYVYYTVTSSISDIKVPALKLEYIDGKWRFDAFAKYFGGACAEECIPLSCQEAICSSETGFLCKYQELERCSCNKDFDCPYDRPVCMNGYCQEEHKECEWDNDCRITQEVAQNCESKGLKWYVAKSCDDGNCKFWCTWYSSKQLKNMDIKPNLKIKVFQEGKVLKIENYDINLTNVVIRLNEDYKKEFDIIASGAKISMPLSEFGSIFKVESIYLYTQQGKWWEG